MSESKSAWFYLGLGCLIVLVACAICVTAGGVAVYRWGQKVSSELSDPQKRAEKTAQILGVDRLPDGYHAVVGIEAPFSLMKIAVLSDAPPDDDGGPGEINEQGFVYLELFKSNQDEETLRGYFEGKTDDPQVLAENNIRLDTLEILRRGVIETNEAELMYLVQRGHVTAQHYEGRGLSAVTLIDCPDDERLRIGIWIGPDPDSAKPLDELDLTGTPADERALASFMEQFRFCR